MSTHTHTHIVQDLYNRRITIDFVHDNSRALLVQRNNKSHDTHYNYYVTTKYQTHMYIAFKVYSAKLVLCMCACILFHLTSLCMYLISITCPFALVVCPSVALHEVDNFTPCVWSSLMAGSLYNTHSHHHSLRCEIKLSYWAQPLLNF